MMPMAPDAFKAHMEDIAAQKAEYGTKPSWRIPPEPVPDEQIKETYDADVVIIGLGHAGCATLRGVMEANPNLRVYALEMMSREDHWCVGHGIGHINSKLLQSKGVPKVDPVEFTNNWMAQAHGKANPSLVMQFARNSGDAVDWWLEPCSQEIKDSVNINFWPETPNAIHQLNTGFKYYVGSAEWWTERSPMNNNKGFEAKDLAWANLRYVEANFPNAHLHYGVHGEQLIKKDGKLAGLIAKNDKGEYIKYNATRFVLSTGGFAGNYEMTHDLLPIAKNMRADSDSDLISMALGRDGSGIKMGYWVGGRLESEISSMVFDSSPCPDQYSGLWLDENQERFMNECFAGPEINGFLIARLKRRQIVSVHDNKILENVTYNLPGHGSYDPSEPVSVNTLLWNLYDAEQAGKEGADRGPGGKFYAADTLEELADYIGYDGEQKARFLQSIERYNALCDKGVDEDFGKDPRVLFPVKEGPFYAHVTAPRMGSGLVTTGAFVTNNDQVVLDKDYRPIEGLYATGNTCGMRFGPAYITPVYGVSIGMCVTLGRICGQNVAKSFEK